ncbi:hybrid sensor histidine kinase/response regulator [Pseudodesulfovibrio thermohalotolerans]|uniref:hybrid sensor histidine kinase/response regulator n=1 Tax=Pseudodesulfovibrio thermohalotolerans TaxID=2880651 RepID=UPI00299F8BD4|nr:response regulator [Pseudodesulfovibrio thermohalotolerans]
MAERTNRFRVLTVDHDESMRMLYRDILCYESEEPSALEALFGDDARLPSREEIDEDAIRPVFEVVQAMDAESGYMAMEHSIARGEPFSIALVDIHLSDLGEALLGLELAESLRSLDPNVEIVLLSARHSVPLKEFNKRVQPPEKLLFVQKPFRSPELKQIALSLGSKWDAENRLRDLNETLASKVEARTSELNAANRRLRLDIAKRAAVLRELQASEKRYRLLFERNITGNFAADPDGGILDCNATFAEMFDFLSPKDALGANIFDLWERAGGGEPLRDLLSVPGRMSNQEVVFTRGVLRRHLLVSCDTVAGVEGDPVELRGYLFDISEPKRLEEQLRQSQKMEALGTLAGGIAHDFNNILGVILGYAEIIESSAEPDSGLERRIREISRAGRRARDLVTQILNFSRQGPQERHSMTLTPLIKEALKLLRSSVPSNVEIITRFETDRDQVMADPTQMHQILLNLCGNASQAMQVTGGAVTLTLADVRPDDPVLPPGDLGKAERFVRMTVADTGPGIAPDVAERVFDPFFTTKKQGEGTGMGLAMVHGIVKRHDGYVELENHPGSGAAFHVFLPRSSETARPDADIPADLVFREGRILFVDDEKPLTDIGREMLESFGFQVVARTSSIEALEAFKFRSDDFDLIITDQSMPNMTGMEFAREVLKIRADIPIILCTGFSDAVSYDRLRDIGIGDFIMKPILKHDLMASISRLLSGE